MLINSKRISSLSKSLLLLLILQIILEDLLPRSWIIGFIILLVKHNNVLASLLLPTISLNGHQQLCNIMQTISMSLFSPAHMIVEIWTIQLIISKFMFHPGMFKLFNSRPRYKVQILLGP